MNFNDEIYKPLINEILDDIYYRDTNFRTKISLLRHYLEIIVRRLVDYPPKKNMMLGAQDTKNCLAEIENEIGLKDKHIQKTIAKAGRFLNKYNHTQHLVTANKESLDKAENLVFDVISLFFIIHFIKREFGLNSDDMDAFSILPPVIRLRVLIYFYKEDTDNLFLIHKYLLIILKCENKEVAIQWVESRKERLQKVSTISSKFNFDKFLNAGKLEFGKPHTNMYEHLIYAIEYVNKKRENKEVLTYSSFEQAAKAYTEVCDDKESLESFNRAKELKEIIEFLFIGRK